MTIYIMLPPTRQLKKLSDLTIIFADGDWIESKDQSSNGIRLIQTGNVGIGIFKDRVEKARYISEETFNRLNCTEIFENDCLVSRLPEPVGRSCLIPNLDEKLITAVDCAIIRFNKDTNPKFYIYYTQSHDYQNQIESKCSGSTRKRISRNNLGNILIPLPPVVTQQKIVATLDEASAQITASKAAIHSQIDALDALWQSSLSEVFENEEYELVKLNDIFDVRDGTHDSPKFYDDGYPLITSKNLKEDGLETTNVKYISEEDYHAINLRSKVDKGDLLFAMIGTIGNPTIIQETPNFAIKNVALFKPKSGQGIMEYLRYFLLAQKTIDKMTNESKGATQKFVGLGYLRNFKLPLPDLTTQTRIVSHLDQLSQTLTSLEFQYTLQLQYFDELRASILDQAFRGELVRDM